MKRYALYCPSCKQLSGTFTSRIKARRGAQLHTMLSGASHYGLTMRVIEVHQSAASCARCGQSHQREIEKANCSAREDL